jgi:hypothetical protein
VSRSSRDGNAWRVIQLRPIHHRTSGTDMKLNGEPNNWIGLTLILLLVAVFGVLIHWMGLPK